MIDEINILNFRCFRSTRASGLRRINVLVGKNASGKTAFLESIFVASSGQSPRASLSLKAMRQLGANVELRNDQTGYESLWQDLFHLYDQNQPIHIGIVGSAGDSRSLKIAYGKPEAS